MIFSRSRMVAFVFVALLSACTGDSTGQSATPIVLSETSLSLGVGVSLKLIVYAQDHEVSSSPLVDDVAWTTSSADVASVDADGNVVGKKLGGPVTITATRLGHSASTTVIVVPALIDITPRVTALDVGSSTQLTATPLDAHGVPIVTAAPTWSLSFPNGVATASITTTGRLLVTAPGPFTVSAEMGGGRGTRDVGVASVYDGVWSGTAPGTIGVEFVVRYGVVSAFRLPTTVRQACSRQALSLQSAVINAEHTFTISLPTLSNIVTGTFTSSGTMTGAFTEIPTIDGCTGIQEGPVPASTFSAVKQ